jgi:deoxyribose-phosphate aldolase
MNNPGIPFQPHHPLLDWEESMAILPDHFARLNATRENIELLISCLDLTSLKATDTHESIEILLELANSPVTASPLKVAAVCVYQPFVAEAARYFANDEVNIATVAGGFPHGQLASDLKATEVTRCVELGADEVDIVINRTFPLTGNWELLYNEVSACKKQCDSAKLKVILATGELKEPHLIYKSAMVCMMAGADFIKTSTGMEAVNATIEAGYFMMKAIKKYLDHTNIHVGIKPAGGIRTADEALAWLALLNNELGIEWSNKRLFRIGASSLLNDLVKQL